MPEAPSLGDLTIDDDGNVVEPDPTDPIIEPDAIPDAEPDDADDSEPGDDPPGEDPPGDDAEWLRETGTKIGLDLTKYKTRDAALTGLASAAKKVGERDQYAQFARELLTQYSGREHELEAILQGRQPAQAAPAAAPTDDLPKTPEEAELLRSQVRTDDDGNLVAVKGAPANALSRYERYSQELSKRLHLALFNPKGFFKDQMGIDPEAQNQQWQQQLQMTVAQREQQDWVDRHADELWVDGNREFGHSPLGAAAQEIWESFGAVQSTRQWEAALNAARRAMPKVTPRKPTQAARHRPTTAPASKSKQAIDAILSASSDKEAEDLVVEAMMRESGYGTE